MSPEGEPHTTATAIAEGAGKVKPGEPLMAPELFLRPSGERHFDQMTKAEQDEALGPDIAEAVRTGKVKLEDLTVRSGEDFITQAPPKDLGITNESEEG